MIFSYRICIAVGIFVLPFFAEAQKVDTTRINSVKMVNKLKIGNAEDGSIESSLSNVSDISIDQNANIYIADEGSMHIKVFDNEGNHLQNIGRRGRGPGEFLSFKATSIINSDELIVVDKRQFRITKFSNNGEVLETFLMSKETQDVVFFNQISQLENKNHLILYKKFGRVGNEDEIFHIWNQNFDEEISKFGSFERLDFSEGFAKEIVKLAVGSFTIQNDGKILFTPSIYEGNIYSYKKINDEWIREDIKGYSLPRYSYENYSNRKKDNDAFTLYTPRGEVKGDIYITSMGIFDLNSEYIAHFSMIRLEDQEKEWKFGVELFDEDLNYLGYYELNSFSKNKNLIQPGIRAKDKDDNFYMIHEQNEYPVVYKFSLDIQTE